jgi:hypothetical protein
MICEVVKLEVLDKGKRLDHIKKLRSSVKGSIVVEPIVCSNCLTRVNPLCELVSVNVRTMEFGLRSYTVLEPECPLCGTFISSEEFLHLEN